MIPYTKLKVITRQLRHPLYGVPAIAKQIGYWYENGRNIGLELEFLDGHHCHMTYQEVEAAQDENDDYGDE